MKTRLALLFGILILIVFFNIPEDSSAQTYSQTFYVRPPGGQYGSGDGSDWANAFSDLPETLVRGAKYYVASGVYSTGGQIPPSDRFGDPYYIFDDVDEGSRYIGVFKATENDHGADTGWESALGQGSAQLGQLRFITGYYEINGQTGSDTEGHGFKIVVADCGELQKGIYFPWNSTSTYIELKHLDIGLCGEFADAAKINYANEGIYSHTPFARGVPISNITISYCYIHDVNKNFISMIDWEHVLVENSYFARTGEHDDSNGIGTRNPAHITIRNNVFEDVRSTYIGLRVDSPIGASDVHDVHVYSNVFRRTPNWGPTSTHGRDRDVYAIVITGDPARNISFYNNTIHNVRGYAAGVRLTDSLNNVQIYNNLWANNRVNQIDLAGTGGQEHDYNAFHENWALNGSRPIDGDINEPHKQVIEENPLVAPDSGDFRLRFATDSGLALSAPFNFDPNGNLRGEDGIWDRGAYELPPSIRLMGIPGNGSIQLNWQVNADLPAGVTWRITYMGTPGTPPSPINELAEPTRNYSLTNLTNYEWYTITLEALDGGDVVKSATVMVMPTDKFVYLPIIIK